MESGGLWDLGNLVNQKKNPAPRGGGGTQKRKSGVAPGGYQPRAGRKEEGSRRTPVRVYCTSCFPFSKVNKTFHT